ncbi:MAG: hypothetical protein M3297_13335 [Thermoproteota archaeon]|jgi:hypothetical protein|nr:hypothetical protein [Thermoproteota archaeon]
MNSSIHKIQLKSLVLAMAMILFLVLVSPGTVTFTPLVPQQEALAQQEPNQQQSLPTVQIPVSKGYVDGKIAYFIATDASDRQAVESIKNNTGYPINYAPVLVQTPQSERGQGYLFLNGVKGDGPNGFQLPVANAVPGDQDYSPIWESNFVTWNDNATARELKSVEEILAAQSNGELTIDETDVIVNSPAVNYTTSS